jgi:uncharacterized membrane protein YbhN (UPF0104 family)
MTTEANPPATPPTKPTDAPKSLLRRWGFLAAQLVAFGAIIWFLVRQGQHYAEPLRHLHVEFAWGALLLASALTASMYLMLVWTWRNSMSWWGPTFTYRDASRIWFASNLARFVPGGIWQFAGIATMAAKRGISAVAANGAAILQQVVIIVAGLALTLGLAPDLLGPGIAHVIPAGMAPTIGVLITLLFALAFPRFAKALGQRAEKIAGHSLQWPTPPTRGFALYVVMIMAMWLVYGVAFWLFGRALFGSAGPALGPSIAIYTAAYVAGIIAIIAPGGLGVREAALTAALTPVIGGEKALVMALASRLWLLAVEVVTASLVLALVRPSERPSDRPTSA